MPQTNVYFYEEAEDDVPVQDWLRELDRRDARAARKCQRAIQRLEAMGHELRRPQAAPLRDGIHELRVREGRVNYRVLYFFHGKDVALLAHGLTKEREVPPADIDRAIARKERYAADPENHRLDLDGG